MSLIPQHVAIIMDGNGRWGIKNKGSRSLGHNEGIKNINQILKACHKHQIRYLTLFCFSFDNWKRSFKEVKKIFLLFENFYNKHHKSFIENNIKLRIIGENKFLPKKIISIKKKINNFKIKEPTLNVNVALNYSSKYEILNAIKKTKVINLENLQKNLYTFPDPDPDILIRTGNRKRLSDFMLWQSSYTEIFFLKKLWPDFKRRDFNIILQKFKKIKRNFGYAR